MAFQPTHLAAAGEEERGNMRATRGKNWLSSCSELNPGSEAAALRGADSRRKWGEGDRERRQLQGGGRGQSHGDTQPRVGGTEPCQQHASCRDLIRWNKWGGGKRGGIVTPCSAAKLFGERTKETPRSKICDCLCLVIIIIWKCYYSFLFKSRKWQQSWE